MKIIAVSNQKGGVGKSTTSINLGAFLARDHDKKVLLVDLDPQGNTTAGLGIETNDRLTLSDLLCSDPEKAESVCSFDEVKIETSIKGLDLLPSDLSLALAEMKLYTMFGREFKLRQHLVGLDYDYIIIDCPPSFTMLTMNAFTAATEILMPIQMNFFCMKGVDSFLQGVKFINSQIAPVMKHKAEIKHVLMTFFDLRPKMSNEIYTKLSEIFGDQIFETKVPINNKLNEAQAHGKPIFEYDRKCKGFIAYSDLAKEFVGRK